MADARWWWAVCSFDPFELEMHITPATIRAAVTKEEYAKAIMVRVSQCRQQMSFPVECSRGVFAVSYGVYLCSCACG